MKKQNTLLNDNIIVIKTCEGYKALKIYFDDEEKSYKMDLIDERHHDKYEDLF